MNKNINDYHCLICGNSNGVLNKNHKTNEFFHQICLILLNELKELQEYDIIIDNIRKWRYKNSCRYCGVKLSKSKAVIKCKNPKCKQFYHIPCAIEKGMIFDLKFMKKYYNVEKFSDIPFYCSNHNKKISFMYKKYILNGNNNNESKQNKIWQNLFIFKNKKIKSKINEKEKINKKILFKITKNNRQKNKIEENNKNNNINKENNPNEESEIIINEENIDNYFEENKKNNIFNINMDLEKIIKDSNTNKKIFLEEYEPNFQNFKNYNNDCFSKGNDENSIFSIK